MTSGRRPTATELARSWLLTHLREVIGPALTPAAGEMVLDTARLGYPNVINPVVRHLREHPDALTRPSPHCPAGVVRLLRTLEEAGHGAAVTQLGCAICGRTDHPLTRMTAEGRACGWCVSRSELRRCDRCGEDGHINRRDADGGICRRCYRRDESNRRPCSGCGRTTVPNRRIGDNAWLCQTCAPRPLHPCSRCGTLAPSHANDEHGAVCKACYTAPARRCGKCGLVRPVGKRGRDGQADLCTGCYRGQPGECNTCGRVRDKVSRFRGGDLICDNCRPREPRTCAGCGRERRVQANWPMGPVCTGCYRKIRAEPAGCSACGTRRVLVGRDPADAPLCGPCCGVDIDFSCTTCGHPGNIYADGQCSRCVLHDRVTDLLRGPGRDVPEQLQPLIEAFVRAPSPYALLLWLRKSPAARLLAGLPDRLEPITHHSLDALPPGPNVQLLRATLVHAGILPTRDERIAEQTPWINHTLAELPAHQLRLLRPFAEWEILRSARRTAARRGYTYGSANRDRGKIRAAIEFLTWIDTQGLGLADLHQTHIDQWITSGPPKRRALHTFLRWTAARHLSPKLQLPLPRPGLPVLFHDEEEHLGQLQRCLNDDGLPREVRIAGALIRLYAMPISRIVELTIDRYQVDGDDAYLIIGANPVVLPPKLARLVQQQIDAPRRVSALGDDPNDPHRYLLPGRLAGRPVRPDSLALRLRRHQLPTQAAHNTALAMLISDLPAVIVSDLIGINISTANQWLGYARTTWTDYLAARHDE